MATTDRPAPRTARPRAQRTASRAVHLIAAAFIGTQIYAPEWLGDALRPGLQFVVIPAAAVTGLFLWRQAQIRSFLTWRRTVREVA